jgi:hypothetical protein
MNFVDICEDLRLAVHNLSSAVERIRTIKPATFSADEIEHIADMLTSTFWRSLPHFVEGRDHNPIHHNTQALDNMVQIGLGETFTYPEFRNATLLALLHDIGNAVSQRPKVKTDQVKAALKRGAADGTREALKAVAFRLEHMDNGPELARDILTPLGSAALSDADIHLICRAITVHDYPSIEKVLKDLEDETGVNIGCVPGDFLLPFDNTPFGRLITWLREADRLFMLSEQGILKDLADDAVDDPSAKNILDRLKGNAEKHRNEFLLYERAGKKKGFKAKTLYRTETGYNMFRSFQRDIRKKYK